MTQTLPWVAITGAFASVTAAGLVFAFAAGAELVFAFDLAAAVAEGVALASAFLVCFGEGDALDAGVGD